MSRPLITVLLLMVALSSGCLHAVPPLPASYAKDDDAAREHAESLRGTVQALVDARVNLARVTAAESRARAFGLSPHREGIDWFSLQDNLVAELPGATPRLIYLVAHVDKTDINAFKVVSLFLNGLLDEPIGLTFFSEGALDNGTGVAVVLEVARTLAQGPRQHTVRVLLTGEEESGLRGARAHVARLSDDEWSRIDAVINVDSVGRAQAETCVSDDGDPQLLTRARAAAQRVGATLGKEALPAGASADHVAFASTSFGRDFLRGLSFNITGGLLPQRSWFTGAHTSKVVNLSSCGLLDGWDLVGALLMLPLGQLHGPRDNATVLDPARLDEVFRMVLALARDLDAPGPVTDDALPAAASAPPPAPSEVPFH